MTEKNKRARNSLISRFIRITAVTACTGAALAGIFYSWAQMNCMMTGVKTDTVDISIFEFFGYETDKE